MWVVDLMVHERPSVEDAQILYELRQAAFQDVPRQHGIRATLVTTSTTGVGRAERTVDAIGAGWPRLHNPQPGLYVRARGWGRVVTETMKTEPFPQGKCIAGSGPISLYTTLPTTSRPSARACVLHRHRWPRGISVDPKCFLFHYGHASLTNRHRRIEKITHAGCRAHAYAVDVVAVRPHEDVAIVPPFGGAPAHAGQLGRRERLGRVAG